MDSIVEMNIQNENEEKGWCTIVYKFFLYSFATVGLSLSIMFIYIKIFESGLM